METVTELETTPPAPVKTSIFQSHVFDHLQKMENSSLVNSKENCIRELRNLGIGDFGTVLWNMPDADFPKLSSLLPPMTSLKLRKCGPGQQVIRCLIKL